MVAGYSNKSIAMDRLPVGNEWDKSAPIRLGQRIHRLSYLLIPKM